MQKYQLDKIKVYLMGLTDETKKRELLQRFLNGLEQNIKMNDLDPKIEQIKEIRDTVQ